MTEEERPRRVVGRPFQKGQSGNPAGRAPKGQTFAEALRAQLEAVKNGTSNRDRLAAVVLEKAMKGDLEAVKWIIDRVDGKVADRVEADVTNRHEHEIGDATLDAVLARYAALRRLPGGEG